MVAACHMVGHEVHHHLHPRAVGALYQRFPFVHAVGHALGHVGVDVVVVFDGVWRSGLTFYHIGIVGSDAEGRVVGGIGVLYDAGVPHVGDAEVADLAEHGVGDLIEFAAAVLLYGAIGHEVGVGIGEEPREHLIDDRLGKIFRMSFARRRCSTGDAL